MRYHLKFLNLIFWSPEGLKKPKEVSHEYFLPPPTDPASYLGGRVNPGAGLVQLGVWEERGRQRFRGWSCMLTANGLK